MKDSKIDILRFWFEETHPSQWFQTSADFDNTLRDEFLNDYQLARDGVYDGWKRDGKGCLALCLLLDQFPRNMFRGTPQAFNTDDQALLIARHTVSQGFDKLLEPIERRFIYLPYEHSENLNDQKTCLALFETIKDDDPQGYDYAKRHFDVIARFGRFPHRNAILGRETTPDEQAYLDDNGGF
jgi:uncharacterized protein (DUF924 family)